MVSYPRRPQSGHLLCYLNRTYPVLPTVGKKVLATGTLFGEHAGHHHTPVLLTVHTLDDLPK